MRILLSAAILLLLTSACSAPAVTPPKSTDYYFQEGERAFERGRYDEAVSNWEKVRDSYYSPELNILAEMKIAEAYFQSERYSEAAVAYEDFLKQHPDHPRTAEVMFQLGLAYFNQMLSADRDQTTTHNALSIFTNLQKRFPDFPRQAELEQKMAECRDRLAEHELRVGEFYLRTKEYQAAVNRFQSIFTDYPEFVGKDELYYHLGHAYLMLGKKRRCADAFNALYHQYPSSEYILLARKLVEKKF